MKPVVLLLLLLVMMFSPLLGLELAGSAMFTVNTRQDVNDLTPGNNLCVAYIIINPPFVLPFCTLRAAIEETNALPGEDTVILGSGTYRLHIEGRNEDAAESGDLDITDTVRIVGQGVGKTIIDAAALDRVFDIHGRNTSVLLADLTLKNGVLPENHEDGNVGGGGLRNDGRVQLVNVVVKDNKVSGMGGGLLNRGVAELNRCTLAANRAGYGGGIANGPLAELLISQSTLHDNTAWQGAGLWLDDGNITLENTTISDNRAPEGASLGGGILSKGTLSVISCTIADNRADLGGGVAVPEGSVQMQNTLLANNIGHDCEGISRIQDNSHNLDSDHSCGLEKGRSGVDARLGVLWDNGGPTLTRLPAPGSPAIDAGGEWMLVATDQRGVKRPQRKALDVGAVEVGEFSLPAMISPLLLRRKLGVP